MKHTIVKNTFVQTFGTYYLPTAKGQKLFIQFSLHLKTAFTVGDFNIVIYFLANFISYVKRQVRYRLYD